MNRLYNLLACLCFSFIISGINSAQDGVFKKLPDGCVPVIDGVIDPVWAQVKKYYISRPFQEEVPSLALATWQASWNDTSIFIIVTVEDDDFYPEWESGDYQWMSDKVELYFDVNGELKDEGGPMGTDGHYQIAPWFYDGAHEYYMSGYQWTGQASDVYATIAYRVNDPDYVYEYALNIQDLRNKWGAPLDPYGVDMIGFDVTVVDRDEGDELRKRAVWRNTGEIDESWANMDQCGTVSFSTNTVVSVKKPEIRLKGEDILICIDSGSYSYNWYYENQLLRDEIKQFCRISSAFTGYYYITIDNEYGCKTKSNPFYYSAKSGTLKNTEPVSEEINLLNVPEGVYMLDILYNNKTYLKRVLIN